MQPTATVITINFQEVLNYDNNNQCTVHMKAFLVQATQWKSTTTIYRLKNDLRPVFGEAVTQFTSQNVLQVQHRGNAASRHESN